MVTIFFGIGVMNIRKYLRNIFMNPSLDNWKLCVPLPLLIQKLMQMLNITPTLQKVENTWDAKKKHMQNT